MSIVDVDPHLALHWDRWVKRRSSSARDRLIVAYSPLVKFLAGRVGAGLPSSVDPGDLVSSGVIGLIDALERFDPAQGVKFETFATPRIRGSAPECTTRTSPSQTSIVCAASSARCLCAPV